MRNKKYLLHSEFLKEKPDRDDFTDADPGKTPVPEKLFDYEAGYEISFIKIDAQREFILYVLSRSVNFNR